MKENWQGRPGRPVLHPGDPSVRLTLTLRTSSYNAVAKRAADARMTVPEFLRRTIDRTYLGNHKSEK
jgi:hypothetical protein